MGGRDEHTDRPTDIESSLGGKGSMEVLSQDLEVDDPITKDGPKHRSPDKVGEQDPMSGYGNSVPGYLSASCQPQQLRLKFAFK